jgi:hypothetical protein
MRRIIEKRIMGGISILVFAATLLLNFTADESGSFVPVGKALAFLSPDDTGTGEGKWIPKVGNCTYTRPDGKEEIYAYVTVCDPNGSSKCSPTTCPPVPTDTDAN